MKFYNKLEEILLAASLLIMVVLNFVNVLSRYIFKASFSFTEELVIILFIWSTMIAAALAFKRKAHIGLSVLVDLFPEKLKTIVSLFGSFVTVSLMCVLIYYSVLMMKNEIVHHIVTSVLEIPEVFVSSAIVTGAVLIVIRVVEAAINDLRHRGEE